MRIRNIKNSSCVLPEEEKADFLDNIFSDKKYIHAIDSYCWAIMVFNFLVIKYKDFWNEVSDHSLFKSYLSLDPKDRPNMKTALKLSIFNRNQSLIQLKTSKYNLFSMNNLLIYYFFFPLFSIHWKESVI